RLWISASSPTTNPVTGCVPMRASCVRSPTVSCRCVPTNRITHGCTTPPAPPTPEAPGVRPRATPQRVDTARRAPVTNAVAELSHRDDRGDDHRTTTVGFRDPTSHDPADGLGDAMAVR